MSEKPPTFCQNGCGTQLTWDALKTPPPNSKRAKEGKIGWFVETLTKRDHVCPKYNSQKQEKSELPNKTVWIKAELDEKQEELAEGLRAFKVVAYHVTKEEHPELDDQSNLFGQMVNANVSHLIQLAKIKAIKSLKESSS